MTDRTTPDTESTARVGIVGLGTIGRIHADRIAELGHDIVAAADVSEDARAAFEADYGVETVPSHEALYERDVDGVFVTTPNRFHEAAAVDALEAGLDVLLEKPIAHTVESAERIATAARDSDGRCMVGFTMRFSELTREIERLREEGTLGDLTHVRMNYLRRKGAPGGGGSWFTDPEVAGGGVLIDLGVHVIDLALYVLDYPEVLEVSAVTRADFGDYDVEDAATVLIRCADGRSVTVEVAWKATRPATQLCTVRGTEAGVQFDVTEPDLTLVDADREGIETIPVERGDMHLAEDRTFLEAVAGGEPFPDGTVSQGLTVQRIIDAAYESSEKERGVRVSDEASDR